MRHYRNQLNHLLIVEGKSCNDEEGIRQAAPKFYKNPFNSNTYASTFPKIIVKKLLTREASNWLIGPVTDGEVKKAVFQFNPDTTPGVDGFNAYFYQKHWAIVGNDVTISVKSFFQNG